MLRRCGVYLSFFTAIIELIRGVNAQNHIRAEQSRPAFDSQVVDYRVVKMPVVKGGKLELFVTGLETA